MARITTIVIRTEGDKIPDWIYDAHTKEGGFNGVRVTKIADGDALKKLAAVEDAVENTDGADDSHFVKEIGDILDGKD